MQLKVNGTAMEAADGTTVCALLERLELTTGRVAVARNGEVVLRADHPTAVLEDGDEIEIIHAVAGG